MDYNIMYSQIGPGPKAGSRLKRQFWTKQATDSYMAGFHRAYTTNRAPFFIGNHFEGWNGGIYMTALESALRQIAAYPDVRLVSFGRLADWLDAQDPAVLAKMRTLDPGVAPLDARSSTDRPHLHPIKLDSIRGLTQEKYLDISSAMPRTSSRRAAGPRQRNIRRGVPPLGPQDVRWAVLGGWACPVRRGGSFPFLPAGL